MKKVMRILCILFFIGLVSGCTTDNTEGNENQTPNPDPNPNQVTKTSTKLIDDLSYQIKLQFED